MFPVARRKRSAGANSSDTIPVYCHCRMRANGGMFPLQGVVPYGMLDVSEDALNDSDLEWFCNLCM